MKGWNDMSAGQRKAAMRKMMLRYKGGKKRSVAEAIAAERQASFRAANYHKAPKKVKK